MSSVDEKIHTIKKISRSIKSSFIEHEVKSAMFSLQEEYCPIAPIDKAAKMWLSSVNISMP